MLRRDHNKDIKPPLTKPASDVVLRLPVGWICENLRRRADLDQSADVKKSRVVRDATGLLHVVRHCDNRVAGLEFVDQFLDLCRGDRIERRTGLIHKKHFRLDCERASDAKSLLLAAGKTRAWFM